jgi:hypothetical protein
MIIAASCADYSDETAALAAYLRVAGQLTPGLALRALLCGQTGLFEATMVELTGLSPRRVAGLVKDPQSNAFAALYSRAGLPSLLLPAFRAALAALARLEPDPDVEEGALRLPIIDAALKCCLASETLGLEKLVALLRRFETDAAREGGLRELKRMLSAHKAPETLFAGSPVLVDADSADIAAFELPVAGPAQALDHAEALDPADAVALSVDDPAPPFEFAIDLDALEKELIAA